MLTLITGAPGSGKSNAMVSLLANELVKDRIVYVNGIDELKIPGATIVQLDDPNEWHNVVPDGSAIVLDEVQTWWRPRANGSKPPEAIQKLETHRHRGIDFFILTQGPNLIDSNVRALVGRHIHIRDLGLLGRWWYEWPECADNCRTAWKNAPIKKKYKLDKEAQKMYKSASIHIKPIRSFPFIVVVLIVVLIIGLVLAYKSYSSISSKLTPKGKSQTEQSEGAKGAALATPTTPQADQVDAFDATALVPRIRSIPNSAPAYDKLRTVVEMPRVAGGITMGKVSRCYSQQGTYIEMSNEECLSYIKQMPFDPYSQPKQVNSSNNPHPVDTRSPEVQKPQ